MECCFRWYIFLERKIVLLYQVLNAKKWNMAHRNSNITVKVIQFVKIQYFKIILCWFLMVAITAVENT